MSTAMTIAPPPDAAGASEFGFEVVITVTSVPDLVAPGELHQVAVLMDLAREAASRVLESGRSIPLPLDLEDAIAEVINTQEEATHPGSGPLAPLAARRRLRDAVLRLRTAFNKEASDGHRTA